MLKNNAPCEKKVLYLMILYKLKQIHFKKSKITRMLLVFVPYFTFNLHFLDFQVLSLVAHKRVTLILPWLDGCLFLALLLQKETFTMKFCYGKN
ncbi:hypothetical protein Hanom_Chr14g01306301 [Helianthus anomalus]